MKELLKCLKESASTKTWSEAVELSRQAQLQVDFKNSSEMILRVSSVNSVVGSVVTLWPKELDWGCDCNSDQDPCVHVIAATILTNKSKEKLLSCRKTVKTSHGTIGYRFRRKGGFLSLERLLVSRGKSIVLTSTLASLAKGRRVGPNVIPTKNDYAIESLLSGFNTEALPAKIFPSLFSFLKEVRSMFFEDKKIKVSTETTGFILCVEDEGSGLKLYGKQDPDINEIYRNGVALCGKTLRPLNNAKLTPSELKILAQGAYYGTNELSYVVSELVPSFSKKIKVLISSKKVPTHVRVLPRVEITTIRKKNKLIFSSRLAYGRPIIAFVENGRLVTKGKKVPERNLEQEKRLQQAFQDFFHFNLEEEKEFIGEDAVFFVRKLSDWDGKKLRKELAYFSLHTDVRPVLNITSEDGSSKLDLTFSVVAHDQEQAKSISAEKVLKAWSHGLSVVQLQGGGWLKLPKEWLENYGNRIQSLFEARDKSSLLPKCMSLEVKSLCVDLKENIPEHIEQFEKALTSTKSKPVEVESCLLELLRPYQRDGVQWLATLQDLGLGALLADDMGLGKTLQSICILKGKSLIVAPTSVIDNWYLEISKFRPNLKVSIYHGGQRSLELSSDVIITTYAIVRRDFHKLSKVVWDVLVLDESQYIKNPESKISHAVFGLSAKFRVALSGTPVENCLDDIWSVFYFLNRGLLGDQKAFHTSYVKPILSGDEKVSHRLRSKFKPFILRRLKSEVAKDLPSRTDVILYSELSEEERTNYTAIELTTKKEVLSKVKPNAGVMKMLEALLRLRQASCHGALVPGVNIDYSSKVELLVENLEKCIAGGHKALIFSQWTSFLDLIEKPLTKSNHPFLRIDGKTKKRQKIVDTFSKDDSYPILLLSLKAAGVGLNLTAADHVFIMDPWWNPAVEEQAADRSYRIGQDKPVIVHKLVAKGTVEEKVVLLQERKKKLVDSVVQGGASASGLSREDILDLLS